MIDLEGNDTFSESNGTVTCCVEISELPEVGLGDDVVVEIQTKDVGGANDASMEYFSQCDPL